MSNPHIFWIDESMRFLSLYFHRGFIFTNNFNFLWKQGTLIFSKFGPIIMEIFWHIRKLFKKVVNLITMPIDYWCIWCGCGGAMKGKWYWIYSAIVAILLITYNFALWLPTLFHPATPSIPSLSNLTVFHLLIRLLWCHKLLFSTSIKLGDIQTLKFDSSLNERE